MCGDYTQVCGDWEGREGQRGKKEGETRTQTCRDLAIECMVTIYYPERGLFLGSEGRGERGERRGGGEE